MRKRRTPQTRNLLALDLSIAATGWAFAQTDWRRDLAKVETGTITTSPEIPLADRLMDLVEGICGLVDEYGPDEVWVEDFLGTFGKEAAKQGIQLGELRGCVRLELWRRYAIAPRFAHSSSVRKLVYGRDKPKGAPKSWLLRPLRALGMPLRDHNAGDAFALLQWALKANQAPHYVNILGVEPKRRKRA